MNKITIIIIGVLFFGLFLIGYCINRLAKKPFLRKHYTKHVGKDKPSRNLNYEYSIEKIYSLLKEHYKNLKNDQRNLEILKTNIYIEGINCNVNFILGIISSSIVGIVISAITDKNVLAFILMIPVAILAYIYIYFITKIAYYKTCLSVLKEQIKVNDK
jgi:hypothetical protein